MALYASAGRVPLGWRIGRPFIALLIVVILVVVGLLVILVLLSQGQPSPLVDGEGNVIAGSFSEKTFVKINGVEQGMFIRGTNKANPVLLYLHGGMPDYFLTEQYPTGLERSFTVCWWEQRGAGISYDRRGSTDKPSVEQLISDTLAVTNYLRERFGNEKVYLMAHSGGTFIGIQAVARAPELYAAYIGVSQISLQLKSEVEAYQYMLAQFEAKGDARMVRRLKRAPVTLAEGVPSEYLAVRDVAMHRLGVGTMHDMHSVLLGIFVRSFLSPQYTLREKLNTWRAKARSGVGTVWSAALASDVFDLAPRVDVPVYLFEGVYDYTCSYTEAKIYFRKLGAPVKGFYTFKSSAHSPLFEEPARVQEIIRRDVLSHGVSLADET